MMKLVLCKNRECYDRFIETLWRHDKNTLDYRYIGGTGDMRGFSRESTKIIKLSSFSVHPYREALLHEAEARFDMRPLSEIPANERPARPMRGPSPSLSGGLIMREATTAPYPAPQPMRLHDAQQIGSSRVEMPTFDPNAVQPILRAPDTPPVTYYTVDEAGSYDVEATSAGWGQYSSSGEVRHAQEETQDSSYNPPWRVAQGPTSDIRQAESASQVQEGLQSEAREESAERFTVALAEQMRQGIVPVVHPEPEQG